MSHRKISNKANRALKKDGEKPPKSTSVRAGTKQEAVLALLRRPGGADVATIVKTTGWQEHSVRGFFASVVRKKLGLTLTSEKLDGKRSYRLAAGKTAKPAFRPQKAELAAPQP